MNLLHSINHSRILKYANPCLYLSAGKYFGENLIYSIEDNDLFQMISKVYAHAYFWPTLLSDLHITSSVHMTTVDQNNMHACFIVHSQ